MNEEVDPKLVIARLKREIVRLKAELAVSRGGSDYQDGVLPDYEKETFVYRVHCIPQSKGLMPLNLFRNSTENNKVINIRVFGSQIF